jgi:hypothetical protein
VTAEWPNGRTWLRCRTGVRSDRYPQQPPPQQPPPPVSAVASPPRFVTEPATVRSRIVSEWPESHTARSFDRSIGRDSVNVEPQVLQRNS